MKNIVFCVIVVLGFACASVAREVTQSASSDDTFHYLETEGLAKPLLLIVGPKGFLGCGYIDVETCNKTSEACAIVTGVKTTDDMKIAEIRKVSKAAEKLGIKVGMKGSDALNLLK